MLDCQQKSEHLVRFGAREIPRDEFLSRLERGLRDDAPAPRPPARRAASAFARPLSGGRP